MTQNSKEEMLLHIISQKKKGGGKFVTQTTFLKNYQILPILRFQKGNLELRW